MDGGVCGPFGRHLGVLRGIGSLVEYRDLKPRIVLLSGCTVAVLAYIFRSQRVTLKSFSQRLPYIYSSPFRLPRFIISRFNSTFRAFGSPNGSKRAQLRSCVREMIYFSWSPGDPGLWRYSPQLPFTQMLAVLEAVIGQFFMAVLVAWLVGMFIYDNFAGKR